MTILSELETQAHEFNFFQAIRLIEHLSLKHSLSKEIQFDSPLYPSFCASEVTNITKKEDRWAVTVGFLGLYGPYGGLNEDTLEFVKNNKIYLDFFGSKLIYLFYQTWKQNRFYIQYDEDKLKNKDNVLEEILFCFLGLIPSHDYKEIFKNHPGLFCYSSFLSEKTPTAHNLKKIISSYFETPVSIIEFYKKWIPIPTNELMVLSIRNKNNKFLGKNIFLGKKICNTHDTLCLVLGPLNYQEYKKNFPGSKMQTSFKNIISLYVGAGYDVEIKVLLKLEERPLLCFDYQKQFSLGWDTWL